MMISISTEFYRKNDLKDKKKKKGKKINLTLQFATAISIKFEKKSYLFNMSKRKQFHFCLVWGET
jgi:hypothetical protein